MTESPTMEETVVEDPDANDLSAGAVTGTILGLIAFTGVFTFLCFYFRAKEPV